MTRPRDPRPGSRAGPSRQFRTLMQGRTQTSGCTGTDAARPGRSRGGNSWTSSTQIWRNARKFDPPKAAAMNVDCQRRAQSCHRRLRPRRGFVRRRRRGPYGLKRRLRADSDKKPPERPRTKPLLARCFTELPPDRQRPLRAPNLDGSHTPTGRAEWHAAKHPANLDAPAA